MITPQTLMHSDSSTDTRGAAGAPLFETGIWRVGGNVIDLSLRPHIMGVLNVTPDSFSDGSLYLDPERAADRALAMQEEGADIVDIGGESTRPYAAPVDAAEELKRVVPVIERLSGRLKVPVSIDTYKSVVARAALKAGACIVNDISGCTFDPAMPEVVAEAGAGLVVMHTRNRPDRMQNETSYQALVPEIIAFLRDRIASLVPSGIPLSRIVVDPGIGFGKSLAGNLEILRRLGEFAALGRPVLVGTSRKSFIGTVLGRAAGDRLFGTAATVAVAVANGAAIVRVHDVREMRDAALMAHAIGSGRNDQDTALPCFPAPSGGGG
jgi:dihydropteroate synthase